MSRRGAENAREKAWEFSGWPFANEIFVGGLDAPLLRLGGSNSKVRAHADGS